MLDELNQEIKNKLDCEGDRVFIALLANLKSFTEKENISPDIKNLYIQYIYYLYKYVKLKRQFVKYKKYIDKNINYYCSSLEKINSFDFDEFYSIKRQKNDVKLQLCFLNKPYGFLHPSNWEDLEEKKIIFYLDMSNK